MRILSALAIACVIGVGIVGCEQKAVTDKKVETTVTTPEGEKKASVEQKTETTPSSETKTTTEKTEKNP
jgi:hypothetical protein